MIERISSSFEVKKHCQKFSQLSSSINSKYLRDKIFLSVWTHKGTQAHKPINLHQAIQWTNCKVWKCSYDFGQNFQISKILTKGCLQIGKIKFIFQFKVTCIYRMHGPFYWKHYRYLPVLILDAPVLQIADNCLCLETLVLTSIL